MASPLSILAPRVSEAIVAAFGAQYAGTDPVLRPSQYADVQVNAALALAKRVGAPPRDVAQRLVEHLDLAGICGHVEVSGPGFLNLTLSDAWIAGETTALARDDRLGLPRERPQRVVIDYSAPNVA